MLFKGYKVSRVILSPLFIGVAHTVGFVVPSVAPSTAALIDPAQLSISIEFFTFPEYTEIPSTANCLANLQELRGTAPGIRIGGTTQ